MSTTIKAPTGNKDIPELEFSLYKGRDGWQVDAKTVKYKGYSYMITGSKAGNGKFFSVTAIECHENNGIVSYQLFGGNRYKLYCEPVTMVTEKAATKSILPAALKFGELMPTFNIKPEYHLGEAFDFNGDTVYYIKETDSATSSHEMYAMINDEVKLYRSILERFVRLPESDNVQVAEFLKQSYEIKQQALHEERKLKNLQADEAKEARKAVFAKYRPEWAKAALVAEYHVSTSDPMTDYFGYKTEKVIIIGWSASARNDFPEMRTAALNLPETVHLNADDAEEHRENYSMGDGLYLGTYKNNTGWSIRKQVLTDGCAIEICAALQTDTPAPAPQISAAMVDNGKVEIKRNEDKNGIEIKFAVKPSEEVLQSLSSKGFRWSRFKKLWYATYNDARMLFATQLQQAG